MKISESIDRRQFGVAAALALLGGAAITIGCGGGSSLNGPSPAAPSPSTGGGSVGSVSANHAAPHVAVITAAQLGAGMGLVLDISNGIHSHTVTLTGTEVTQIAAKVRVSKVSTTDTHSNGTDPHSHVVTFN